MRLRTSVLSFLAAAIIALTIPTTAEAIPPGVYFIRCQGGWAVMVSIIGYRYAAFPCGWGDWTVRLIVSERVATPDPPTLDPAENEVWHGMSASEWVAYLRNETTAGEDGEYIDPAEFDGDFPTLTCNEADFDPPAG